VTVRVDDFVGESTEQDLVVPLPPVGRYKVGDPLHAVARESIITAWEALALRWQSRHPLRDRTAWGEVTWLLKALEIDPACEPVAMRLMAVAEGIGRRG